MELLSGWKEIAEHLHLTVRTAQRWEGHGLPVRRVSDSSCSPVVAICDELESWARTRDVKADAALLASNKFLVTKLTELRQTHTRTRRKTMRLLGQISFLGSEQKRLIFQIRSHLQIRANSSPPRETSAENEDRKMGYFQ
jgi:hypothetical protein